MVSLPEVFVATSQPTIPIRPLLAVNFVGTLGFSIVLPFLVFLVDRWGGNALVYGVLGATYSAFQLVGAPILGRWSDRRGRKRILLLSQLGTLASWGIFLVAFALPVIPLLQVNDSSLGSFTLTLPLLVLFVARALDGLTGGNVSVAHAYLADISSDADRNVNFGKMAISANLGFILGPAIAGLLGSTAWGELLPVLAALLISVVASGLIAWRLPESLPCALEADDLPPGIHRVLGQEYKQCVEVAAVHHPSFLQILRLPRVSLMLSMYFLVMLGFNFFYVAFPVHAVQDLQWSVRQTGAFFAVLSLLMVIVQGPVLRRALKILSDRVLVMGGTALLAISFPFLMSSALPGIYLGVALLALGNGLMWPSVVAILAKVAGHDDQGAVQGVAGSLGAIASILGMIVGGILFDSVGVRIFLLPTAILLVVFVLSLRMSRWSLPATVPEASAP